MHGFVCAPQSHEKKTSVYYNTFCLQGRISIVFLSVDLLTLQSALARNLSAYARLYELWLTSSCNLLAVGRVNCNFCSYPCLHYATFFFLLIALCICNRPLEHAYVRHLTQLKDV